MSSIIDFDIKDGSSTLLKNKHATNNAQQQEINDLIKFVKLEQTKYLQKKIICDLIEDLNRDNQIEPKLKTKVKDIILCENLKQTSSLDDTCKDSDITLLGVGKQNSVLTYSEGYLLQEMVKVKLSEATESLAASHNDWAEMVHCIQQLKPIQMTPDDEVLLEYKNKLGEQQQEYIRNLLNLHSLLEQITNIRVVKLPEVMGEKMQECQLEQKINHLKCILAEEKCRVEIFTETNCSLKAYKNLIEEVKQQQKECEEEIEDLVQLKEEYKQISGKQYDDILQSYLQYKACLEKKKVLYDCLNS